MTHLTLEQDISLLSLTTEIIIVIEITKSRDRNYVIITESVVYPSSMLDVYM